MKLIDILLRHKDAIAERGEATNYFAMDPDGRVFGYQAMPEPDIMGWSVPGIKNSTDGFGCLVQINPIDVLEGWQGAIVTLKQYEAALAAIKQGWNGDGIPPVGCKCEYTLNNGGTWHECTVEYLVGTQGAVLSCDVYEGVQYVHFCNYDGKLFRPIRSEEEKKREEAVIALSRVDPKVVPFEYGDKCSGGSLIGSAWYDLYDAIAAGKIPHIRIE